MFKKITSTMTIALLFVLPTIFAQTGETEESSGKKVEIAKLESKDSKKEKSDEELDAEKKDLSGLKYRLIQDSGFLVDGAFTQEEGYVQHTLKFRRTFKGGWQSYVEEEMPLGSEKHELSFTIPASGFKSDADGNVRGFGDVEVEYRYRLTGGESSRVTVSPTFGLSLPTGSYRQEMGSGGFGTEVSLPVSIAVSKRFMTNSSVGVSFTPRARNSDGDRASATNFEVGQSFVWLAKPKFNALVEMVWERNNEVIGPNLTRPEYEAFVSPGFRWGHTFKNGLTIVPGIAVPIGVGPSKGENGVFFYLSFEHPFKKRGGE